MSDPKFRSVEQMLATIRQLMGDEEADTPLPLREPAKVVVRTSNPFDNQKGVGQQCNGDRPLEAVIRALLEPMLRAWLDQNLRSLVEREVRSEIARRIDRMGVTNRPPSARTSARRQR